MPARKRSTAKPAKGKRRAKARTSRDRSPVEEFVRLQQRSVRRVADVWANAADRAAKGTFSVTQLIKDYTSVWGDMVDDYAKAIRTIAPKKR